jgi:hypothetical protein
MLVPASVNRRVRLSTAFKIEPQVLDVEFDATLAQLHDEALLAIRETSPRAYAAIVDVYERLLLTVPATWARYGQQFAPGIAGGLHPSSSRVSIVTSPFRGGIHGRPVGVRI